jgi:hypothetical protein
MPVTLSVVVDRSSMLLGVAVGPLMIAGWVLAGGVVQVTLGTVGP